MEIYHPITSLWVASDGRSLLWARASANDLILTTLRGVTRDSSAMIIGILSLGDSKIVLYEKLA